MANKKPTMRQPTASWFQRTDQGVPELQSDQAPQPQDVEAPSHSDAQAPEPPDVQSLERLADQASAPVDASDTKRWRKRKGIELDRLTIYLEPSDVEAMRLYQLRHYQRTREKLEQSEIARQAIRAWIAAQDSSS
jgi:hypothetical protein